MTKRFFVVTKDHIKLARNMWVSWNDGEAGAPTIDCKRPYGNSDVEEDICKILKWKKTKGYDEYSSKQINTASNLHKEMEIVLQIILTTGKFKPGKYVEIDYKWQQLK